MTLYNPSDWFWIVAGDEDRAFSSADGRYVDISQVDFERATRIDSEASMIAVLRRNNVPPYHQVTKSTIISRLTDKQLSRAVSAFALSKNLRLRERWYSSDQPAINADDPESISFIQDIGANPLVILAPE